jgi:hypothetical protein
MANLMLRFELFEGRDAGWDGIEKLLHPRWIDVALQIRRKLLWCFWQHPPEDQTGHKGRQFVLQGCGIGDGYADYTNHLQKGTKHVEHVATAERIRENQNEGSS